MSHVFRVPVLLLALCALSATAFAQDGGARVAGSYAGTFGEGETNVAAGGSVGYRFTPHVGFELEAFALPDLEFDDTRDDGRGVVFLTNFVAEFPSPVRWALPYVQGGGGIANLSSASRIGLPVDFDGVRAMDPRADPRRDARGPMMAPGDRRDARTNTPVVGFDSMRGPRLSQTGLALSVGGGVDFTVWRGFAVGPTISYLKLFSNLADRDLTRVGLRTTYRF
jgi:hypothetical protein